jgi:hypothetical protein
VFNETYSTENTAKYPSDKFPIQNGLKQGDALSLLLFNFLLEYSIMRVLENQEGPKLNGTQRVLAYADEINRVGENTDTVTKSTDASLDARKEACLEVNPQKTEYMLILCYQKTGQKLSIKTAHRSFEDVAKFKHLETKLTDQNCMHEGIKSRLNSGNSTILFSLLSSRLLSRNLKVKM